MKKYILPKLIQSKKIMTLMILMYLINSVVGVHFMKEVPAPDLDNLSQDNQEPLAVFSSNPWSRPGPPYTTNNEQFTLGSLSRIKLVDKLLYSIAINEAI